MSAIIMGMKKSDKFTIFASPGGFIEIYFKGEQTPESVTEAVKDLVKWSKKLEARHQKMLILADVSDVSKIDISGRMAPARKVAVEAMQDANYEKIAVFGNIAVQIMVNTLALIAGKRQQIKVFPDRMHALRWLKGDT